jgi:hypothetical protein
MKKVSIFMSILISFGMLMTYSCTKDDSGDDDGGGGSDPIPEKIRITNRNDLQSIDSTLVAYEYNDKKLVGKEVWKDKNKVAFKVLKYEYNTSDKLIRSKEYQDAAMTIVAANTTYTLNASGLPTKSVNDRAGNITTITYTYNSGRLAKAHIEYTGASSADPEELEFVWTGDNVSKITYKVPDTTGGSGFVVKKYEEMEFDAKSNPYFEMGIPSLDPVFMSKNNVTKVKEYDANNVFQHLTSYNYSKYEGDFPKMAMYDLGYRQGVYEYKYKKI